METRRTFLTGLALVTACSGLVDNVAQGQSSVPQEPSPIPVPGHPQPSGPEVPPAPNIDKKILENNDKDIKKKVEQLYQLANELREEVEKTDSSKVLSLNLVKKAEEIEKLAHDIKNRSKG